MTTTDEIQQINPKIQFRSVTILEACELWHLLGFLASVPINFFQGARPQMWLFINPVKGWKDKVYGNMPPEEKEI